MYLSQTPPVEGNIFLLFPLHFKPFVEHRCEHKLHSNRVKLCFITSRDVTYNTSKIQLRLFKYFDIKSQTESNLQQLQLLALHHQTVSRVWTRCSLSSEWKSCRQSCAVSISSPLFMQTALILAGWER